MEVSMAMDDALSAMWERAGLFGPLWPLRLLNWERTFSLLRFVSALVAVAALLVFAVLLVLLVLLVFAVLSVPMA